MAVIEPKAIVFRAQRQRSFIVAPRVGGVPQSRELRGGFELSIRIIGIKRRQGFIIGERGSNLMLIKGDAMVRHVEFARSAQQTPEDEPLPFRRPDDSLFLIGRSFHQPR